jgi:hypothetical protein
MIDYFQQFESFNEPGAFNLLDSKHKVEFYIGIDMSGRKTLVIRSKAKPDIVKSTSAIEVSVGQVKNNIWSLGFHLILNSMSGLFYRFCDDLVESSRDIPENLNDMNFIVNRYDSWKKMFYNLKKDVLSENEIMGLIGELLFLHKDLAINYGMETALKAWSGSDKTHKDFSINDVWFEVKSTKSNSLTIRINSLEQLDSDIDGFLIIYEFEKMSEEFEGYSLNNVIRDILILIDESLQDLFLEKLRNFGYNYDDTYDKFMFRLTSSSKMIVNSDFPRIQKSDLSNSIVKVEYDLLKQNLKKFKVI